MHLQGLRRRWAPSYLLHTHQVSLQEELEPCFSLQLLLLPFLLRLPWV